MHQNFLIFYYHNILPKKSFDIGYHSFNKELKILKSCFKVVPLSEIYQLITRNKNTLQKIAAITFDDGYLDNFVYAYPLLKKYRLKATIFPISSRILKKNIVRPTLTDYWNSKLNFKELYQTKSINYCNKEFFEQGKSEGFISRQELRKMVDVFEVGSHGSVHARVFYKPVVVDYFDENNGHWSFKYTYEEKPVKGYPIFPHKNNLSVRRGFLKTNVKDFIKQLPPRFFNDPNWKQKIEGMLMNRFTEFLEFESEKNRINRIEKEAKESKDILEKIIGKKIYFFSLPFGQYDSILIKTLSKYYKAVFTTKADSVEFVNSVPIIQRYKAHKDIFSFIGKLIKFYFNKL